MTVQLFIADEHLLFRQGLRALLTQGDEYAIAGEAGDGKAALAAVLLLKPDIVLLNIAMPGMNGMDVTAHIKRRLPETRVVMLTAFKAEEYLRESLRVGADGYLLRDTSFEELALALRHVSAGRKYLTPSVAGQLVDGFLNQGQSAIRKSPLQKLTSRERGILQLIAEGRTNRATAEFLNLSPKTVEKHRSRMMQKLGLKSAAELMLAAMEMGMIDRPWTVTRLVERAYS